MYYGCDSRVTYIHPWLTCLIFVFVLIGEFCANCWSNYYREGAECIACGEQWLLILFASLQFVFLLLLIVAAVFASDAVLSGVLFALICFRYGPC